MASACLTLRFSPNLLSADCHTPLYPERPSSTNNGYYTVCHPYAERTWGTKRDRYNKNEHWRSFDEPPPIKDDWVLRVQTHHGSGAIPVQNNFVIPPHLRHRPREEKKLVIISDEICPPPEKYVVDKKILRQLDIPEKAEDPYGRKVLGELFPVHNKNRIDPKTKQFVLPDAVRAGLDELEQRYYSLHDRLDPFEKRFDLSCRLNAIQRSKAVRECLRNQLDQRINELQIRNRLHTRSVSVEPYDQETQLIAQSNMRPLSPESSLGGQLPQDFIRSRTKEEKPEACFDCLPRDTRQPEECLLPPFQARPVLEFQNLRCPNETSSGNEQRLNRNLYGERKKDNYSTVEARLPTHLPLEEAFDREVSPSPLCRSQTTVSPLSTDQNHEQKPETCFDCFPKHIQRSEQCSLTSFQARPVLDSRGVDCSTQSTDGMKTYNVIRQEDDKNLPSRERCCSGRLVAGHDIAYKKDQHSVDLDSKNEGLITSEASGDNIDYCLSHSGNNISPNDDNLVKHQHSSEDEQERSSKSNVYKNYNKDIKSKEMSDLMSSKMSSESLKNKIYFPEDRIGAFKCKQDKNSESILDDRLGRLGRPEEEIAERELERMMYMHRRGKVTSRLSKATAVCDVVSPHKKPDPCHPYWTSRNENQDPTLLKLPSKESFQEEEYAEIQEEVPYYDPDKDIKKRLGHGLICPYPPEIPPDVCPRPLRSEFPKLPCPPPGQPNAYAPMQVMPMTAEQIERKLHPGALFNPWIHEPKPLYQPSHYKMMIRKSFHEATKGRTAPDLRDNKRNLRKNYFYGGYHSSFFR